MEAEDLAERVAVLEAKLKAIEDALGLLFVRSGGCKRADREAILPALLRTAADLQDALGHATPRRPRAMVGVHVRTGRRLPDGTGTATLTRTDRPGEATEIDLPAPKREMPEN